VDITDRSNCTRTNCWHRLYELCISNSKYELYHLELRTLTVSVPYWINYRHVGRSTLTNCDCLAWWRWRVKVKCCLHLHACMQSLHAKHLLRMHASSCEHTGSLLCMQAARFKQVWKLQLATAAGSTETPVWTLLAACMRSRDVIDRRW